MESHHPLARWRKNHDKTLADLAATKKWLETAGFRPRALHDRLVVGPGETMGAVIAFESA